MILQKAALYCRTKTHNPEELAEQQALLEAYAKANNMEIVSAFFDEGSERIDMYNPVHFRMLCSAKQNEFDLILVLNKEVFPVTDEALIPPLKLCATDSGTIIEMGNSTSRIFDKTAQAPEEFVYYHRM